MKIGEGERNPRAVCGDCVTHIHNPTHYYPCVLPLITHTHTHTHTQPALILAAMGGFSAVFGGREIKLT